MTTTTADLREAALAAAAHGWPVFPLRPGTKQPAIVDWQQHATTESAAIVATWRRPCNIGIATGPARLVVLDSDVAKPGAVIPPQWAERGITTGEDVLAHLAEHADEHLPETYTVRTPTGGYHRYYRNPDGVRLGNTTGRFGWLLDTRARGGFVVAPGSITPTGTYTLITNREPAALPRWIVQRLAKKASVAHSAPRENPDTIHPAYARKALRSEIARVAQAKPGTHNATLNTAAFNLGQLIGAGALTDREVREELLAAAEHMTTASCDCTTHSCETVINSALAAGIRNPRTPRHRSAA